MVCLRVAFLVSLLLLVSTGLVHSTKVDRSTSSIVEGKHAQVRKLLNDDIDPGTSNRIGRAGRCSIDSISLYQGQTDPLPSGIPTYTVRIMNTCYSRCNISDIHLRCGDFSSTVLIDPTIFRRIEPGNCLVKDGGILGPDEIVTFRYANSFMYPLSVWWVKC